MIKRETIIINETEFIRTYSDAGFKIHKIETSEIYDEAIDIMNTAFLYEETDELREIIEQHIEIEEVT